MSADTTGHKSRVNAFGFYVARNKDNLAHSKIETITQSIEVVRRQRQQQFVGSLLPLRRPHAHRHRRRIDRQALEAG